jgi:hypothetical protein
VSLDGGQESPIRFCHLYIRASVYPALRMEACVVCAVLERPTFSLVGYAHTRHTFMKYAAMEYVTSVFGFRLDRSPADCRGFDRFPTKLRRAVLSLGCPRRILPFDVSVTIPSRIAASTIPSSVSKLTSTLEKEQVSANGHLSARAHHSTLCSLDSTIPGSRPE